MKLAIPGLLVGILLLAHPAEAGLVSAPATGASGVNSAAAAATWEARGHLDYSKVAAGAPGYYVYPINTHTTAVCGNGFCTGGAKAYSRILCVSGAGVVGDGVSVTINTDRRLYLTSTAFRSAAADQGVGQVVWSALADGQTLEVDWDPSSSTSTNQLVLYKIGTWQSGTWTPTTSVGLP